jgi:hypothetical protein
MKCTEGFYDPRFMQGSSLISRRHGFSGPIFGWATILKSVYQPENFSGLHRWLEMTYFMNGTTIVHHAFVQANGEV